MDASQVVLGPAQNLGNVATGAKLPLTTTIFVASALEMYNTCVFPVRMYAFRQCPVMLPISICKFVGKSM